MPNKTIYTHKHHIIPKHAGGTDDPSNLVELTIEEHAEAHRVLYEKYGRWQDKVAWQGLSGQITNQEASRIKISEAQRNRPKWNHSQETKDKISKGVTGERNGMYGKDFTEEHRENLSKSNRGYQTEETKRKLREINLGTKRSEETKQKNRENAMGNKNMLGKTHSEETKRILSEKLKAYWRDKKNTK